MTQPRDVDVVVLTALGLEYDAVRAYLTETVRHVDLHGTRYEIGGLSGSPCRVALAQIGEGNATAAALAGRAVEEFVPEALMFVGVAGGIHPDVALGDVVVATRINALHSGREDIGGFNPRLRGWLLSHGLEQLAREMAGTGRWAELPPGPRTRPKVHFRPLVSGDVVLDSRASPLATMLAEQYGDAVAIDMESAGFAEAAHRSDFSRAVTIRGISDLADGAKRRTDAFGWQPRAAANAAAFAMALAEQIGARPLRARPGRRPRPGSPRPCPYRGLAAFRERDADLFFGRTELADELAELVSRRRFVAVVGRSGSGKSSLVHAGLMPRMRGRDWAIAAFRPLPDVPAATVLAGGLLPLLGPGLNRMEAIAQRHAVAAAITAGRLPELVGDVLTATGKSRLLVVVDQFEEFVARDEQAAHDLAELLVQLSTGAVPAHVVLTLRMETLGIAVSNLGLGEIARNSVFLLSPMQSKQLRSAIEAPLEPTGRIFEPGLVERILESAEDAPEALALVQFALTQLWEGQQDGLLAHAAYDGFGGVGGALAGYAEHVWTHELDDGERTPARRLLVQLVRPDDGDVIRRTARGRELEQELVPIARRLASTRLVVTGVDADGESTFDLAHAALAVHWQRLRNLLGQERQFRTWQEDLRESMRRTEPLRGPRLTSALRWQREHPDDITGTEREFITAGRRGHRRRTFAWRSSLAAIVTLLLLASAFAVVLQQRSGELRQQVRINASQALLAQSREPGLEPDVATLLTVAAYRSGQDPAVLANLAGEFLRYRSVDRQFNPGVGRIRQLQISANGRTIAALGEGGVAVWEADRPSSGHRYNEDFERIALSPDGKLLAGATEYGQIQVRQLGGASKVLHKGTQNRQGLGYLRFDASSQRLLATLIFDGLRVWDVNRGRAISVPADVAKVVDERAPRFPGQENLVSVWFGPGGTSLIVSSELGVTMSNLATGRSTKLTSLTAATSATVTPDGRTAITCASNGTLVYRDLKRLQVRDTHPGPRDACRQLSTLPIDHTGSVLHAGVRQENEGAHPRGLVTLLNPAGGKTAHPGIPTGTASHVGHVIAGTGKGTRLVVAVGPVALTGVVPRAGFASINKLLTKDDQRIIFSDDMRWSLSVIMSPPRLRLWDLHTGHEHLSKENPNFYGPLRFSPDNQTLLAVDRPFEFLLMLDPATLEVTARLKLSKAPIREASTPWIFSPFDGICVERMPKPHSIAFYFRGFISTFDTRSGKPTGSPLRVWHGQEHLNRLRETTACTTRPGRREIALNTRGTANPGQPVELWDLDRRRQVASLPISNPSRIIGLKFSADGRLLAALAEDGSLEIWDVDRRQPVGDRLKVLEPAQLGQIVDFPAADRIIVSDLTTFRMWDLDRRAALADINVGHGNSNLVMSSTRKTFLTWTKAGPAHIPVDPRHWAAHLCRTVGRDLTPAERKTMPPGSPTGKICP